MAVKKIKGTRFGQEWRCRWCGETLPWFMEPRPGAPDGDACVLCQCEACLAGDDASSRARGACGKYLDRCDTWLRRGKMKGDAPETAARNRAWSALTWEYGFRDLYVMFRLAEAGIISASIPSAEDEAKIRLFRHHIFCDKKFLRIQMSMLRAPEKERIVNGHPSAWRTMVLELCRKHYEGLADARAANGGKLRRKDFLNYAAVAATVIDRLRLRGKLTSVWIKDGEPTRRMLREVRRLALIVKNERRGMSKKWLPAAEKP